MKTTIFLIILLSYAVSAFAQSTNPDEITAPEHTATAWQVLASSEGRFSIEFPGSPAVTTQDIEGLNEPIKLKIHSLRTFAEYSVMYADYPIPIKSPAVIKEVLDNGAKGAVDSVNSQLLEIKEINLDNYPGRFLKKKMSGGKIMRVRIYLVGQRMYQIAVTTPSETTASEESRKFYETTADKFLNSFKMLKEAESTGVSLAANAPPDKPVDLRAEQVKKLDEAIKPYIQKAKDTYPEAKKRYLTGLPPKETFFITTRLHDKAGRFEQVFIAVKEIKDGLIKGVISSDLHIVSGYNYGDSYSFPEGELIDWTITKPDGSEEGNFVGKFLDTYQP